MPQWYRKLLKQNSVQSISLKPVHFSKEISKSFKKLVRKSTGINEEDFSLNEFLENTRRLKERQKNYASPVEH
ncbi:MAG: hypothetical protein A3H42_00910 [Deltaproteobacteria bacterium RIFCSPLOWO2_02_FULL_46_8]|nr:MAG: hypothetical protein A3H42_00910 [Deltaproteobacteria bacterium RIFCSPLOWO2_02_FULL_46_8]